MKKFLTFIFGIIVTLFFSIIPASANSAVRKWVPTGAQGVYLVSDNPIDVKKEDLTFDLGVSAYVTAEYTFYNSSDSNIEAELLFPIGIFGVDTYYKYEPTVLLDGTKLDIEMRLLPSSSDKIVDSLYKLKDEYVESSYDTKKFYYVKFSGNTCYITLNNGHTLEGKSSFAASDGFYFYTDKDKEPDFTIEDSLGQDASFTIEESSVYAAVKDYYIRKCGKDVYESYSEIDLYNAFVDNTLNNELYAVIDYNISISAKGTVVNTVKTNMYYGEDNGYDPHLSTIEYFLEPARSFNSFENLTVKINMHDLFLITNNLDIKTEENANKTYEIKYDKLPEYSIHLGLCQNSNPSKTGKNYAGLTFLILGMAAIVVAAFLAEAFILVAGILVMLLVSIKKKIIKNVFMLIIENAILAIAIVLLSVGALSTYDTYSLTMALAVIYAIALSIRLAGALIFNKNVYSNKIWIIDGICVGFECLLIVMAVVIYYLHANELIQFMVLISIILFAFNIAYTFFRKVFYINKEEASENKAAIENNKVEANEAEITDDNETEEIKEENKEE